MLNNGFQQLNMPSDVLRFCIEEGGITGTEGIDPNRDSEDYEWLKQALTERMETDIDRMQSLITQIIQEEKKMQEEPQTEETINGILQLLEKIQFFVEDLDNANDFHKLGGLDVVARLLSSPIPNIRMWCAWIVTSLVQNNPAGQKVIVERGVASIILKSLEAERDEKTRVKFLSAISGFLSENKDGQRLFLLQPSSLGIIRNALKASVAEQIRGLAILRSLLLTQSRSFHDVLRESMLLNDVLNLAHSLEPENEVFAKVIFLLSFIVQEENAENKRICHQRNLWSTLRPKLEILKQDLETYLPEIDLLHEILQRLS